MIAVGDGSALLLLLLLLFLSVLLCLYNLLLSQVLRMRGNDHASFDIFTSQVKKHVEKSPGNGVAFSHQPSSSSSSSSASAGGEKVLPALDEVSSGDTGGDIPTLQVRLWLAITSSITTTRGWCFNGHMPWCYPDGFMYRQH